MINMSVFMMMVYFWRKRKVFFAVVVERDLLHSEVILKLDTIFIQASKKKCARFLNGGGGRGAEQKESLNQKWWHFYVPILF